MKTMNSVIRMKFQKIVYKLLLDSLNLKTTLVQMSAVSEATAKGEPAKKRAAAAAKTAKEELKRRGGDAASLPLPPATLLATRSASPTGTPCTGSGPDGCCSGAVAAGGCAEPNTFIAPPCGAFEGA